MTIIKAITFHRISETDFHIRFYKHMLMKMNSLEWNVRNEWRKWNEMEKHNLCIYQASHIYPNVDPIMSSAWLEMISAIISSFMASLALRHFLPPGSVIGRSWGCKPRKPLALFCFMLLSSVTFCFNSADNSVLASFGSCCCVEMCFCRWGNFGEGKIKYMKMKYLQAREKMQEKIREKLNFWIFLEANEREGMKNVMLGLKVAKFLFRQRNREVINWNCFHAI